MIRLDRSDPVAVLTIDRPEKMGALNLEMRLELVQIVEDLVHDPGVAGIVLTGTPGCFCSGGDVDDMGQRTLRSARALLQRSSQRLVRALVRADKPVIAAVDGPAAGLGWSLVLACDHVVVTPRARFSIAFARIGLVPDGAAVWLLSQRIGPHATKQLVAGAATLAAEEALARGLADARAAPGDVVATAVATARGWTASSPLAFGIAKQLAASADGSLEDYLRVELLAVPQPMVTDEHKAAVAAFRRGR